MAASLRALTGIAAPRGARACPTHSGRACNPPRPFGGQPLRCDAGTDGIYAAPRVDSLAVCRATSDDVPVPSSKEEAIAQACAALEAQMRPSKKERRAGRKKGFAGAAAKKLALEIPVLDDSPGALAELAGDLLDGARGGDFTVAVCGGHAEAFSGRLGKRAVSIEDAVADPPGGDVLVVAPGLADLEDVEELARQSRGAALVLLNAGWDTEHPPEEHRAFVRSFKVVYSFLPLQVQLVMVTQEGAVLKCALDGSPDAAPWRTFVVRGGVHEQVGRMTKRPTSEDIELIMVNASAAQSPINQGIKGARGFLDRLTGK